MSVPTNQMNAALNAQGQASANVKKVFYAYTFILSSIASGSVTTVNVQIQADADFLVQAISQQSFVANLIVTNPETLIQITDTGSGTTFFDQPTAIGCVTGDGKFPFLMPVPRLVTANSVLTLSFNNLSSTGNQSTYINWLGRKLYKMS